MLIMDQKEVGLIDRLLKQLQDFELKDWRGINKFVRTDLTESLQETLEQLEYSYTIFQDLKRFQSTATLTDVTIKVDGKVFHGHRNVLAAVSRYFEAMFATGFQESTAKEVHLRDIDGDIFQVIFNFIYSGKMELSTDTAISAIQLAWYLELHNAERPFIDFFKEALSKKEMTHDEVLTLREAAGANGMHELADKVLFEYLLEEIEQVMESDLFVEKAPDGLISKYLLDNISSDCNEEKLFSCIIHWLKFDWEKRKVHAHLFLQQLRLGLIPKDKVQGLIDAQILEIPECKKMMDVLEEKWSEFEGIDDPMKLPESFLQRRMIKTLVAFGGQRETPEMDPNDFDNTYERLDAFGHYYKKEDQSWWPLNVSPDMPGMTAELQHPSMVVVNRDIYLAGGCGGVEDGYECKGFFKLDGNNYKWTELPPMTYGRIRFAMIHHNGFLYAIGGEQGSGVADRDGERVYLDSVERFNMSQQRWDRIYQLPESMVNTSAVIMDDKIFVYGMKDHVHNEGEFWLVGFDPVTQKGTMLLQERYHHTDDTPDSLLVVHEGGCYRVWYEEEFPRDEEFDFEAVNAPHVNQINIEATGGTGSWTASIGREMGDQGIGSDFPINYCDAFHIDKHLYLNVCRLAHKTGIVLEGRNPNINLDIRDLNKMDELKEWRNCWSFRQKCVVEYAFDSKKMR